MYGHAQNHGIVHGGKWLCSGKTLILALFAIIKLRTQQTSVMGSQTSKNSDK